MKCTHKDQGLWPSCFVHNRSSLMLCSYNIHSHVVKEPIFKRCRLKPQRMFLHRQLFCGGNINYMCLCRGFEMLIYANNLLTIYKRLFFSYWNAVIFVLKIDGRAAASDRNGNL